MSVTIIRSVVVACGMVAHSSKDTFALALAASAVLRTLASIVHRGTTSTALGSLACASFNLLWNGLLPDGLPLVGLVALEALIFLALLCASWSVGQLARTEAIRAACDVSERAALTSMLSSNCDAVVQLDLNFNIVGRSPRLAAMLLHDPEARTLDGEPLAQFLAPSVDRSRVMEALSSSTVDLSGKQVGASLPLDLQNALGKTLHTRAFHVRLRIYIYIYIYIYT